MVARINPDRALTAAEKARRHRERRDDYVMALEMALVAAADWDSRRAYWGNDWRATIARARAALSKDR
jgi:hypothetical protein